MLGLLDGRESEGLRLSRDERGSSGTVLLRDSSLLELKECTWNTKTVVNV